MEANWQKPENKLQKINKNSSELKEKRLTETTEG